MESNMAAVYRQTLCMAFNPAVFTEPRYDAIAPSVTCQVVRTPNQVGPTRGSIKMDDALQVTAAIPVVNPLYA